MTKIAYLQCPTGISGDMCLGAIVSLGVPLDYLTEKLNALGIEHEYRLRWEFVQHNGQEATKVNVDLLENHNHLPEKYHDHHHDHHQSHSHHQPHNHHGRNLPDIEKMILNAGLPLRSQRWSLEVFRQLAVAEGLVHGIPPEKVHFHEVGAVDAIVDIVGTCLGLDWLGIDTNEAGLPLLYCSPFPTGGGTVSAEHGLMPVPVPAVLKLWEMRGCPVYSNGIHKELVTPTGAAIATTLACSFGEPPSMTIKKIGLGGGSLNLPIPNILRLWLGETTDTANQSRAHLAVNNSLSTLTYQQNYHSNLETIFLLETQIDDISPQSIGYVFDALFAAGALDVFTQSIGMKKSRPGILLTVICQPEKIANCEEILFRETTTLGIRRLEQQRSILEREIQSVETKYGIIPVKVAWKGNATEKVIANVQPEYENCAELARKNNISLREIQQLALQSWYLTRNVN